MSAIEDSMSDRDRILADKTGGRSDDRQVYERDSIGNIMEDLMHDIGAIELMHQENLAMRTRG